MQKLKGLHFYINIANFDRVVADEENRTGNVSRSIHELDTFFSRIENFGKSHFKKSFHVEKVTGARLHMYVLDDDIKNAFAVVAEVSKFANKLTSYLNTEVSKYNSLINFSIQIGAHYGYFYTFTFKSDDSNNGEETSIGYVANYAAKLQGLSEKAWISISSKIYEAIDDSYKKCFNIRENPKIKRYGQEYYATSLINELPTKISLDTDLREAREYALKLNLGDMDHSEARQLISFSSISKRDYKKLEGIPFFCDVRGFTEKFEKNDLNLDDMANQTQRILATMYSTVKENNGVHVQFQGDREEALFHNFGEYNCIINAVQAGLRLIDRIQDFHVSVGIGESFGTVFAAKIGARGEKDNLLLGQTVTAADRFEDDYAAESQLVVASEIYDYLKIHKPQWAHSFRKIKDVEAYRTTVGYNGLLKQAQQRQVIQSTKKHSYNGAWGE